MEPFIILWGIVRITVLGTMLSDLIFRSSWNSAYYRLGIAVFKHKFEFNETPILVDIVEQLENSLNFDYDPPQYLSPFEQMLRRPSFLPGEIELQILDAETIAYRRIEGKEQDSIHGRISFYQKTGKAEIVGYFNWPGLIPAFMIMIFPLIFSVVMFLAFVFPGIRYQRRTHQFIGESVHDIFYQKLVFPTEPQESGLLSAENFEMVASAFEDFKQNYPPIPKKQEENNHVGTTIILIIGLLFIAAALLALTIMFVN